MDASSASGILDLSLKLYGNLSSRKELSISASFSLSLDTYDDVWGCCLSTEDALLSSFSTARVAYY